METNEMAATRINSLNIVSFVQRAANLRNTTTLESRKFGSE